MRRSLPALMLLLLAACEPTPRPDYAIRVAPTATGMAAVPPACADWVTQQANPLDQQPLPQFGCATARNLALGVEQPGDLLQGRKLGPSSGVHGVGEILRYNSDQTRGLIDPNTAADSATAATTSSTATSAISGETSSGSSGSSSGSAAAGSGAAAGAAPATP